MHPFYNLRQDQASWYNTYHMSDYLLEYYKHIPDTVCANLWDGTAQFGITSNGELHTSIDGKKLFCLPSICIGSPAEYTGFFLQRLRIENPHAQPAQISMIFKVGGNHFTSLVIVPDKTDANKADIIYVNSFGNQSAYAQEDQQIIAAARKQYPSTQTRVVCNERRIQGNTPSCGVFALEAVTVLNAAKDPALIVSSGRLPNESDVPKLREKHGNLLKDCKGRMFLDRIKTFEQTLDARLEANDFALLKDNLKMSRYKPDDIQNHLEDSSRIGIANLKSVYRLTSIAQMTECSDTVRRLALETMKSVTQQMDSFLTSRKPFFVRWCEGIINNVIEREAERGGMTDRFGKTNIQLG